VRSKTAISNPDGRRIGHPLRRREDRASSLAPHAISTTSQSPAPHARPARLPRGHARIRRIDTAVASAMPCICPDMATNDGSSGCAGVTTMAATTRTGSRQRSFLRPRRSGSRHAKAQAAPPHRRDIAFTQRAAAGGRQHICAGRSGERFGPPGLNRTTGPCATVCSSASDTRLIKYVRQYQERSMDCVGLPALAAGHEAGARPSDGTPQRCQRAADRRSGPELRRKGRDGHCIVCRVSDLPSVVIFALHIRYLALTPDGNSSHVFRLMAPPLVAIRSDLLTSWEESRCRHGHWCGMILANDELQATISVPENTLGTAHLNVVALL